MKSPALSLLEHGLGHLDDFARGRLLCAFDFDGTLAPIVTQPEQARTPLPVLQRLRELERLAPLAVITGRSVSDAAERIGFRPDFLVGNHGQEGLPGSADDGARHRALCRQWKAALEDALQRGHYRHYDPAPLDPNIRIEDKGVSLSLHYRLARDQHAAEQQLLTALAQLAPEARIVGGKCVINVLPPDAPDKGTALLRLMQHCDAESALYVGDDVTDEDVFRLARPDILSVRIDRSPDSSARYYLNHRLDLLPLLDRLLRARRQAGAINWLAPVQPQAPDDRKARV